MGKLWASCQRGQVGPKDPFSMLYDSETKCPLLAPMIQSFILFLEPIVLNILPNTYALSYTSDRLFHQNYLWFWTPFSCHFFLMEVKWKIKVNDLTKMYIFSMPGKIHCDLRFISQQEVVGLTIHSLSNIWHFFFCLHSLMGLIQCLPTYSIFSTFIEVQQIYPVGFINDSVSHVQWLYFEL